HVGFAYQGPAEHAVLESAEIGFGLAMQSDHGKGRQLEPEHLLIQLSMIAGDDARFLQGTHPAQAGRCADANTLCERHVCDAAISLQFFENASINDVEAGTHGKLV